MKKVAVIALCIMLTSCGADVEFRKNQGRERCLEERNEEVVKACLKSVDD